MTRSGLAAISFWIAAPWFSWPGAVGMSVNVIPLPSAAIFVPAAASSP
jgi:hypothetical protein